MSYLHARIYFTHRSVLRFLQHVVVTFPLEHPLYFQVLSPFNTLNFAWLAPLFGEVVAYNVLYMFTFFFAGFTTYVFVKYLTKNNYAAFLAGLAFAFAPIHTGQGFDHLNIMSAEFIPLFAFFMVKMARERNSWNSVYTGAAMVLNAMCRYSHVSAMRRNVCRISHLHFSDAAEANGEPEIYSAPNCHERFHGSRRVCGLFSNGIWSVFCPKDDRCSFVCHKIFFSENLQI